MDDGDIGEGMGKMASMDSWMPITGATDAAYMVTDGDTGYYLRVMATYTDGRARTWPWTRRRP